MNLFQPPLFRPCFLHGVYDDGQDSSHQKEPQETAIQSPVSEESARPQSAPDHAGVEVSSRIGACKAVLCSQGANVGDVAQRPAENGDLAYGSHDEAYDLDDE